LIGLSTNVPRAKALNLGQGAVNPNGDKAFRAGRTFRNAGCAMHRSDWMDRERRGKRNAVVKLVFETLQNSGRNDAKMMRKQIDSLYVICDPTEVGNVTKRFAAGTFNFWQSHRDNFCGQSNGLHMPPVHTVT
jgi:hypothetical protein